MVESSPARPRSAERQPRRGTRGDAPGVTIARPRSRTNTSALRASGACGLVLLALVVAPPASAASAESIADRLRAGRDVVLSGVAVTGRLDLRRAEVRAIFKCRSCTFAGDIVASDATFERTVDVSGSRFEGAVDFSSATFRAPALFRAAQVGRGTTLQERPTTFRRGADFSLATFEDLTSFAGSRVRAAGVFRDTRFADVTFASASFAQTGDFERASFRGVASFNRARFEGETTFREADFRAPARFAQARFDASVVFTSAQFAAGASFLNARFEPSETSEEAARFQHVTAEGSLDFTFATFDVGASATPSDDARIIAIFADVVCGRSVVFRDTTFGAEHRITMSRLQARDLVLDIHVVPQIDDPADQRIVLETVGESAKARGDLGEANDAHYALLALRSKDYSPFWRVLDYAFYRGVAGYFVRPFRPLLVLLALATVLSLVRFARHPASSSDPDSGSRVRRVGTRGADLLTCFLDTLSSIGRGSRTGQGETPGVGERVEVFVYRVLVACALLGLANSNPTLREMFDTLV
jgi:hypothetical protein